MLTVAQVGLGMDLEVDLPLIGKDDRESAGDGNRKDTMADN